MVRMGTGTIGIADPAVFLDIDGVLNAHQFDDVAMSNPIERDKVERMNRILRETGAVIVISSAWRYLIHRGEMNLEGMDWLLRSHGMMAGRLHGITRPDTMIPAEVPKERRGWFRPLPNERGQQIADWRLDHSHRGHYVVIDDGGRSRSGGFDDLGIATAGHPVVWTKGTVGLTDDDASRAIAVLQGRPFDAVSR